MMHLNEVEKKRYSRHIMLDDVGVEGQEKLKNASVLIVGLGGLGSPLALYLAAAGVGRLGLVDFDVVDESNLQRQIIHGVSGVGRSKLETAYERLKEINPHITIDLHHCRLDASNAKEIIANYDIVSDGTDNFQTRYLVNDACILLNKPNVYGAIQQFTGQVSVFMPRHGPCYRCLYPVPPSAKAVPSCAEAGVLGVLPGIIGTIQATEVIKLILNIGEPLLNRLLVYDALDMEFTQVQVKKNQECDLCGHSPIITELINYDSFCGVDASEDDRKQVSPAKVLSILNNSESALLLDVRGDDEWHNEHISGALHIPMNQVENRIDELESNSPIIVVCQHGIRSKIIVNHLKKKGFEEVYNLDGGIRQWEVEVGGLVKSEE